MSASARGGRGFGPATSPMAISTSMPTTAAEADLSAEGLLAGLPIETERLRLRPLTLSDAPVIERLAGDWEVARFTGSIPHPYPAGSAMAWIRESLVDSVGRQKLVAALERR